MFRRFALKNVFVAARKRNYIGILGTLEDKSLHNTDLSHLYEQVMSEYEQGLSSLAV